MIIVHVSDFQVEFIAQYNCGNNVWHDIYTGNNVQHDIYIYWYIYIYYISGGFCTADSKCGARSGSPQLNFNTFYGHL